ncbi:MAG: hypothetical protein ABR579_10675 [Actinomycetota bacterium]
MKRAVLLLLIVPLVVMPSQSAHADFQRHMDGNDVHGRLDIRSVSAGHGAKRGVVVHTLKTFGRWHSRLLRPSDVYVAFDVDPRGDTNNGRAIWVDYNKNGLRVRIRGYGTDSPGPTYGHGHAWRPNLRTLKVAFSLRDLPRTMRDGYRWRAWSSYERKGSAHCEPGGTSTFPMGSCVDRAPYGVRHWYHHRLD